MRYSAAVSACILGAFLLPAFAQPQPVVSVASIADLQALGAQSQVYPHVNVRGYYKDSNVGGGFFDWRAPSGANRNCAPDGGVVFAGKGIAAAAGCWVRQLSGNVYMASWFGAKASDSLADKSVNTSALQALLNAAQQVNYGIELDQCGRYYIDNTLAGPLNHDTYPTQPFRLKGCGASVGFDLAPLSQGSIIAMDPSVDKPLLSYTDWTHHYASGNMEISYIRWEGCVNTRLIYLQVFTGTSSFHHNEVVQSCHGNGVDIDQGAITATITDNTIIGSSSRESVAQRFGTGIAVRPALTAGLFKIIGNTSRGWLNGYTLGGGKGAMIAPLLQANEVSNDTYGIVINQGTQGATLLANYAEGGGDTVIQDCGDRTRIENSWIYGGFLKGIDNASCDTRGNIYTGNYAETAGIDARGAARPIVMIDVKSDGSSRKIVGGNTLSYSRGNPNIIGIRISGANPNVSLSPPNNFEPSSAWSGAGSRQVACAFAGQAVAGLSCN